MNYHDLYHRTKRRAKKLQVDFDLTIPFLMDMTIPLFCPVLGIKLNYQPSRHQTDNSISIDRIDSTRGYTQDNVIFISWRANKLKSDGTLEEITKITEFYNDLAISS